MAEWLPDELCLLEQVVSRSSSNQNAWNIGSQQEAYPAPWNASRSIINAAIQAAMLRIESKRALGLSRNGHVCQKVVFSQSLDTLLSKGLLRGFFATTYKRYLSLFPKIA